MANVDKSQRPEFIYTNVHTLFKRMQTQDQDTVKTASEQKIAINLNDLEKKSSNIIKKDESIAYKVYEAPQFQSKTINELKENMIKLKDMHMRLRFMLKELEDLVKLKK